VLIFISKFELGTFMGWPMCCWRSGCYCALWVLSFMCFGQSAL